MWQTPSSKDKERTGLLAKCPVLWDSRLATLTRWYLYNDYWHGSSGGVQVADGGVQLPAANDLCSTLVWLQKFTDGTLHPCGSNTPGGIAFFTALQLGADSSVVLRASPHTDHRYLGQRIAERIVAWESEFEDDPEEYGHLVCLFSFSSKDADGKDCTQDVALVRKMHQVKYNRTVLLASANCADVKSNSKATEMLQVINVQRILADVVLVPHENPATIGSSWKDKDKAMPVWITADSSAQKGDGSCLWHLPVEPPSHGV
jgi:hypothetical protein